MVTGGLCIIVFVDIKKGQEIKGAIMKCRYCETELTQMETGCVRCLKCNPIKKGVAPVPKEEKKYIDVKLTEERVREIFREEFENWHSPAVETKVHVPLTQDDIDKKLESGELVHREPEELTYRQQAKLLGIKTFGKKKEEVLEEIKAKQNAS